MGSYNQLVSEEEVENSNFVPPSTKKFISKTGQIFGYLTVVKFAGRDSNDYLQYYCKCTCGNYLIRKAHQLTPSMTNKYENTSCGCKYNQDKKIPLSEMIKRVEDNTDYLIVEASELWTSKWILHCKEHGNFKINYSSVQDGKYGCPDCATFGFNPKADAYFYVNALYKNEELIAYKYGITNQDIKMRMRQIVSKSDFEIENVLLIKDDGYFLMEFEKLLKKMIPSGILTKNDIASGFTETIAPVSIVTLTKFVNFYFKEN